LWLGRIEHRAAKNEQRPTSCVGLAGASRDGYAWRAMSPDPIIFEQILTQATEVFGGREAAEAWMSRAAMGLDGQRPLDCVHTEEGAQVVRDLLVRLEYCVYS
jgi:uncharacterized protein (DUF2384 family)